MRQQKSVPYSKQHYCMLLTLLALAGFTALFVRQGMMTRGASAKSDQLAQRQTQVDGGSYLYYTVKQSNGYVLARAAKGSDGQPLGTPLPIAQFGNSFGQSESDAIFSMQLSPDSRYLAIDGSSDHGEMVWIFNIQQRQLTLTPANVMGNFLHWLPGVTNHTFLYRAMFPLGPNAPQDNNGWNPGLWIVDAATGAISNIDIHMSSAFLVDAVPSPDGSRIVYSTSKGLGLGSDAWMMSRDGSNTTHLFAMPGGARSISGMFAWSPDGTKIAYERLSDSPTPFLPAGLWLMNTNGMQQRYLADTDGGHGFALSWSPDSRRIAYVLRTNVSDRSANFSAQSLQSAIAVVDTGTGHFWMVASQAQTGKQISSNAVWTAGGKKLTFTAYNPFNLVLGGTPRYWSAQVGDQPSQPSVIPLTPSLLSIVAIGS